jgi:hypothetical protein
MKDEINLASPDKAFMRYINERAGSDKKDGWSSHLLELASRALGSKAPDELFDNECRSKGRQGCRYHVHEEGKPCYA